MPKPYHWRKQKTLAMLANRRQYNAQYNPLFTTAVEFITEGSRSGINTQTLIVTEARIDPNTLIHTYIIAE